MDKYDFDKIVDRRGSGALKYDALQERYGDAGLLPLWVADMDFATPPFIVEALRERMQHPIFGYTVEPPAYRDSIVKWTKSHHDWEIEPEWISFIPGIVKGIALVIELFSRPGDKVIIQPPVYHPFRMVPEGMGRQVVYNPLIENEDGSYSMDFEQLESVIDDRCRILILSNPHNPAGIVWAPDTLKRLAEICRRHDILVISDEIHSDMTLFSHRHTPFATVSDDARACSITFAAPSKTFNIAGIVSSYAIVPDAEIRDKFYGWLHATELDEPTLFAPIATIAAYEKGEEWRRRMLAYVEENIEFTIDYCRRHLPGIRPLSPQASFLVWLDCRGLGLDHRRLVDLFVKEAGLALNDGAMFGPGGEQKMRLNVATPRATLEEALERLRIAVARVEKK